MLPPATQERIMGTYKPPKRAFNSADLDQLQWIFDSVWSKVQSHYQLRDQTKDEELKGALRRKLFAFAAIGVYDPEMLEAYLLNSIPLGYDLPPFRGRKRRRQFARATSQK
jgi:hypothetical protein